MLREWETTRAACPWRITCLSCLRVGRLTIRSATNYVDGRPNVGCPRRQAPAPVHMLNDGQGCQDDNVRRMRRESAVLMMTRLWTTSKGAQDSEPWHTHTHTESCPLRRGRLPSSVRPCGCAGGSRRDRNLTRSTKRVDKIAPKSGVASKSSSLDVS